MTSPFDDLSPRAAWFMENFDAFGLAQICAAQEAAFAALHEGEEQPADERAAATPAQWLWQWNRVTPEQRLEMIGRIQAAFAESSACFMGDHRGAVDYRKEAAATLARVLAEVDRWMANTLMPQTRTAVSDIRAAFEPPKEK